MGTKENKIINSKLLKKFTLEYLIEHKELIDLVKKETEKQCDIHVISDSFKVGTYSLYGKGDSSYCHWSEGLKMVIEKDGKVIKLEGKEIKKLVGSLPRTVGGTY